jgi:hypothetical protein
MKNFFYLFPTKNIPKINKKNIIGEKKRKKNIRLENFSIKFLSVKRKKILSVIMFEKYFLSVILV